MSQCRLFKSFLRFIKMQAMMVKKTSPEFESRKLVAMRMEKALRAIAHAETLSEIGFKDPSQIRHIAMQIKRCLDDYLFHYISYGATNIPGTGHFVPTTSSWVFLYLYIMLTRTNLGRGEIGSFCASVSAGPSMIEIPKLLMNYVSNYQLWPNHQALCARVVGLAGFESFYRNSSDGDDILCVAAMFGFQRIETIDADYSDELIDASQFEEMTMAIPPMCVALLPEENIDKFYRALTMNRALFGRANMGHRFHCVGVDEDTDAKMIHGYLFSNGLLKEPNLDEDLKRTIKSYIRFVRRTTLEGIPYARDAELDKVFEKRLGLNIDASHSVDLDGVALRVTHLLAITALPKDRVHTVN